VTKACLWAALCVGVAALWFAVGSGLFVWLCGRPVATWLAQHGHWPWMAGWVYWGIWPTPWTRSVYILSFMAPGTVLVALAAVVSGTLRQWRLRSRLSTRSQDDRPPPIELANTDNHGHAGLMLPETARRIFPGNEGKLIGMPLNGGPPYFDAIDNSSGVSLEFIGTRGGKSSRAVAMAALWPDALAIFDPAGELAHMTWRVMIGMGRRVCIVSPDREPRDRNGELRPWAPLVAATNVIGWIDKTDPLAEVHVHTVTSDFFEEEIKTTEKGEFFAGSCESLIAALLAHIIWDEGMLDENGHIIPPAPRNLRSVREFISLPGPELWAKLSDISKQSASKLARRYAGPLVGVHHETFGDLHMTAHNKTRWLALDALADMVCGDDFPMADICYDQSMAIFMQVPMTVCRNFPTLPQVLFGAMMAVKMVDMGQTHILAITDESWMLKVRAIREIILNGGKYGIALHMFWQSVGDLDRTWGRDLRGSFFDSAAWIAVGPVGDVQTAKDIAEACGHYGAIARSKGDNSSSQVGSGFFGRLQRGSNVNEHPIKRMVFYPHEIMQDLHRGLRLILKLSQPWVVNAAPYFEIPELKGLIDDSPYARPRKAPALWYSWFRLGRAKGAWLSQRTVD